MTHGVGRTGCPLIAEFVLILSISSGGWNYTDRSSLGAQTFPPSSMGAPDAGAQLWHRLEWLAMREGRVVTWDDMM